MNDAPPPDRVPAALSRRGLLRLGAAASLAAVAAPVLAACGPGSGGTAEPDALLPLVAAANTAVGAAKAAGDAFPGDAPTFAVVASVRQQHATVLQREISRANPAPTSSAAPTSTAKPTVPAAEAAAIAALVQGLAAAQKQAGDLVPGLPTYRAGLVGSVSAGCASLAEALNATQQTGWGADNAVKPRSGLPADTVTALQATLAAEHTAIWMCGLASAFVGNATQTQLSATLAEHTTRRDAVQRLLLATGATPQPAQAAYTPPKPVTDAVSALGGLAAAEADDAVAWRSVLEHSTGAGLRTPALTALVDAAVRETRWRRAAQQSPASVPLPGQPG